MKIPFDEKEEFAVEGIILRKLFVYFLNTTSTGLGDLENYGIYKRKKENSFLRRNPV